MKRKKFLTINSNGLTCLLILLSSGSIGCKQVKDFFGKENSTVTAPVSISVPVDSTFIHGTWVRTGATASVTRNPTIANTYSYTFAPNGAFTLNVKDHHIGGMDCYGYGTYGVVNKDVQIVIAAQSDSGCGLPSAMVWYDASVQNNIVTFKDSSGDSYHYWKSRAQNSAPVGLWDFNSAGGDSSNEGGIDYLLIDQHGYFVMQTTMSGQLYLLQGYYRITADGAIDFVFIQNDDPNQDTGGTMSYVGFIHNPTGLELIFEDGGSYYSYVGSKL